MYKYIHIYIYSWTLIQHTDTWYYDFFLWFYLHITYVSKRFYHGFTSHFTSILPGYYLIFHRDFCLFFVHVLRRFSQFYLDITCMLPSFSKGFTYIHFTYIQVLPTYIHCTHISITLFRNILYMHTNTHFATFLPSFFCFSIIVIQHTKLSDTLHPSISRSAFELQTCNLYQSEGQNVAFP